MRGPSLTVTLHFSFLHLYSLYFVHVLLLEAVFVLFCFFALVTR